MTDVDWAPHRKALEDAGVFVGSLWEDKHAQPRRYGPSFKRKLFVTGVGRVHSTNETLVICKVTNRTKWGYPEAKIKLSNFKKTCNLLADAEPEVRDE